MPVADPVDIGRLSEDHEALCRELVSRARVGLPLERLPQQVNVSWRKLQNARLGMTKILADRWGRG